MSIKALYYCRPRILILSILLSVFSFFNFLYWQQYVNSLTNISSLTFCLGSILSVLGTSGLFMLHSIPYINENGKRMCAIFILFGAILWFIASCFELSIDNKYCDILYFCNIHQFAYILLPFGISIMIAMDEFFHSLFYFNQRLRVTSYSLLLLLSAALFIPYYVELKQFTRHHHKLWNDSHVEHMNIDIEMAFIVVWSGIALSGLLMILCIGVCQLHKADNSKRNMVSWISSILLCAGSAILIISYIVQQRNMNAAIVNATVYEEKFDVDDPIICYHFLVCAICWILAIDGITNNHNKFSRYQKI